MWSKSGLFFELICDVTMNDTTGLEKFTTGISLLSWGYNEELLIEDFLRRALDFLDSIATDYELIFVNDGSTDKTGQIADRVAQENPSLRVIHHPRNLNVGHGTRTAVAHATKEILFWQTVDWSYDLTHARLFLELTRHYDVVQGIRPVPIRLLSYIPVLRSIYRVKTRSDNLHKAIVSLSNYYLLRILFGLNFHDFQNITFYKTKTVQRLPLEGVSSFINPELLIRSFINGATVIEVPISFIKRTLGDAKGTKFKTIVRSVTDILRNWLSWGLWARLDGTLKWDSSRVHRVSSPFVLSPEVLKICIPLFKEFQ